MLPWCRERPQTAICCLKWLGRLTCLATGLDAFLSSFSTSRRCSRNRSPWRLPSYAVDDIGWGTGEMISELDGSLGSLYYFNDANEGKCFASCACAFKSTRLGFSTSCSKFVKTFLPIPQKVVEKVLKKFKVAFSNKSCSKVAYLVWCKTCKFYIKSNISKHFCAILRCNQHCNQAPP